MTRKFFSIALLCVLFVAPMCNCECNPDYDYDYDPIEEHPTDCTPFYNLIIVRWDSNTLTVITNPDNNGGYDFSDAQYQWFHNGRKLRNSSGQSLLRNPDGGMLKAGFYHVEIIYRGGFLVSCMEYCAFENSM